MVREKGSLLDTRQNYPRPFYQGQAGQKTPVFNQTFCCQIAYTVAGIDNP